MPNTVLGARQSEAKKRGKSQANYGIEVEAGTGGRKGIKR